MRINWKPLMTVGLFWALTVGTIQAMAGAAANPAPGEADDSFTLRGVVEHNSLEGGFYTVGEWALKGDDPQVYGRLLGQEVIVRAREFQGVDFWMVRSVEVISIARRITDSALPLPSGVTVQGKPVAFDQGPVVKDGKLLLPLRAIAEVAGGSVHWHGPEQSVTVNMPDRWAWFGIEQDQAEMVPHGTNFIQRNLIPLSGPPVLINSRTLMPVANFSQILGLFEVVDGDKRLDLVIAEAR